MSDVTTDGILKIAHDYIDHGWHVMLLAMDNAGGKIPPANCSECNWRTEGYVRHSPEACGHLTCHGFYMATRDKDRFVKMNEKLPLATLGIRTGRISKLLVIDAEAVGKGNDPSGLEVLDQWQMWTKEEWSLPDTRTSRSVRGGLHLYYRLPETWTGPTITSGRILPSVDVKCESAYVGAPCGDGSRTWIDESVPVVDAPHELLTWLTSRHRLSPKSNNDESHNFSQQVKPTGYDFNHYVAFGCPAGHRQYFINDLCFRMRKFENVSRDEYEQRVYEAYEKLEQTDDVMPWHDAAGIMGRVWVTVEPNVNGPAWAIDTMRSVAQQLIHGKSAQDSSNEHIDDEASYVPPASPLTIGALENPDHWYGANDDGTAARMHDIWGDWFRAIPKSRGGYAWMRFDGITWSLDSRETIWDAFAHMVLQLPAELSRWEQRCLEIFSQREADGLPTNDDWRSEQIGGNGAQAGQFVLVASLRKYIAACKETGRKDSGVKTFARLSDITIAEDDLDANTRYLGLADGYVLDVEAVHHNRLRDEWVINARPDMLLTKTLGCSFNAPQAGEDAIAKASRYEHSNWRRYLEDVLPDQDVRETLQEIVGYALLGKPTEKMIVLLHGPPDSGKTVFLEVLGALFGTYGGWTDGTALLSGKAKSAHQEWLHNLRGRRLIMTPETPKGGKIDAAWVKSYTGREPQTSRGAFGDRSVTWTPSGIIFNASNHYIEYDAEDTAVAERTQVITFEQQFLRGDPRRDDRLPQRIKDNELSIVLNWALEGLRRHGERPVRAIKIAEKIRLWSEHYRVKQDHVGQFIMDAQNEGKIDVRPWKDEEFASSFALAKTVYGLYKSWCNAQNRKSLGRNVFNSHLMNVYHWEEATSNGKRWLGVVTNVPDSITAEITQW